MARKGAYEMTPEQKESLKESLAWDPFNPPPEFLLLHNLVQEAFDHAQKIYRGHGWYLSDVSKYLYEHGLRT